MSTLFVNNLNTASGSTIQVASGKTIHQTGAVLQVVNAVNNTHASYSSASWTATDISCQITPKFSTSKILVMITGTIRAYNNSGADARGAWRIYRQIAGGAFARVGTHQMTHRAYDYGTSGRLDDIPYHLQYLDSPATTSQVGYKLYAYKEAGSGIEQNPDGDDETYTTLMEIAV